MNKFPRSVLTASALFLAGVVPLSGCDSEDPMSPDPDPPVPDLIKTAEAAGNFETLLVALYAAGLTTTLATGGPFTVFAPTDAAFAQVPEEVLQALLDDPDALAEILTYHVVEGELESGEVVSSNTIETLNGASLMVSVENGVARVDDAVISSVDIHTSNGIIHVIDAVMLPPAPLSNLVETAEAAGNFETLLVALDAAGLTDTLADGGPFTVFAPTDEAFAEVPEEVLAGLLNDLESIAEVLTYHVVAGELDSGQVVASMSIPTVNGASLTVSVEDGVARVDDAVISAVDIQASNGIIHVIDSVVLPPTD